MIFTEGGQRRVKKIIAEDISYLIPYTSLAIKLFFFFFFFFLEIDGYSCISGVGMGIC